MSSLTLRNDEELYVSVFSSTNIHYAVRLRDFRGIQTLKKGEAFDVSRKAYWDNAVPRYCATSNYYVDDPEDEIGCIDAVVTYDPEI